MGVLKSPLFVNTLPATNKKLEACATGSPNEVSTHFKIGETGDHVKVVKQALKDYQEDHKTEIKAPFSVNNTYDKNFATAVAQFKATRKPPLTNFAGQIDEIVGIKTIKALDDVNPKAPTPKPIDPPSPKPNLAKRVNKKTVLLLESEKDDPPAFIIVRLLQQSADPDKQVLDAGSAEIDTSFKVTRIDHVLKTGSIPTQEFTFTFGPASSDDVLIFNDRVNTERVSPTVAQEIYDHPGHYILRVPRKLGTSGFP